MIKALIFDFDGIIIDSESPELLAWQEIFAAQLDAWDQVVETLSADAFFARVIDSQRAWAKRVSYYVLLNNVDTKLAYEHYFGSLNI